MEEIESKAMCAKFANTCGALLKEKYAVQRAVFIKGECFVIISEFVRAAWCVRNVQQSTTPVGIESKER